MRRDLQQLINRQHDLLIIGGGIYGACIAWDAALRGLSVALVEQNDFGSGTSANSLKFIHGGLRYLQDGNLRQVRRMTLERKTWLRIAPHLVHPMPVIVPTLPQLTRSRLALGMALRLNDWIGFDRNRGMPKQQGLANGRLLTCEQYQAEAGWISPQVTGAAMWHDAQMVNSERLLLSVLLSATQHRTVVANYVQATGFLREGSAVIGIAALDKFTDQSLQIRAKLTINCAGVWTDELLNTIQDHTPHPPSLALNLITHRLPPQATIGVISPSGQMLFIAPWQNVSLIGTWHKAIDSRSSPHFHLTDELLRNCLDDINAAYAPAKLQRTDICHVHMGFLPAHDQQEPVRLLRQGVIHDHHFEGNSNLITVLGVKYTTARWVAQQVVNLALSKLNRPPIPCQTTFTPLAGGEMHNFAQFLQKAMAQRPLQITEQSLHHLIYTYGTMYPQLLAYLDENPDWGQPISPHSPVIQAELVHAVRHQMACTLADVVMRRTPLGATGLPDEATIRQCAHILADELDWDINHRQREIQELIKQYPLNMKQQVSL